jgi:dTDP-4-dehydrorhamnose reductase
MIWIIGNKGMLGTEICNLLELNNIPFVKSDLDTDITKKKALDKFKNNNEKLFLEKNSTHAENYIINCAAYTAVDLAEDNPDDAFLINRDGPENIARFCKENNFKLIHISTDYVFNGEKKLPGTYNETDTCNPESVYGKSKWEGEKKVQKNIKDFYIIRTSWLYGIHGKSFVSKMIELMSTKEEIRIVNDQWGAPTHTKDLASLIISLATTQKLPFGIYHYSNYGQITWFQFASRIQKIALITGYISKKTKIIPVLSADFKQKARRPANSCFDLNKIKQELPKSLKVWTDSLSEYFNILNNTVF